MGGESFLDHGGERVVGRGGGRLRALLTAVLPADTMSAWGWRVPFLLGLLVGLAGYFLRRQFAEGAPRGGEGRSPLRETVQRHSGLLLRLAGLSMFNAVSFYLLFVYIVSWLQLADGIAPTHALAINSISMVVLLPCMVGMGALSDRLGRKPILLAATVLAFVSAVPLFWLMHQDQRLLVQLGQLGLLLSVGMFLGTQPTLMVEEVPAAVRCTAIALGHNVTLCVVGGLSPLVATWLVNLTGDDLSRAYMIMAAAAVSFLAALAFASAAAFRLNRRFHPASAV